MAEHLELSDGWYLQASALASRFDERLAQIVCAAAPPVLPRRAAHANTLELWSRLLGDPAARGERWQRRVCWSGWREEDVVDALATPIPLAAVVHELREFAPVLRRAIDEKRDPRDQLRAALAEAAMPNASSAVRKRFDPLITGLVEHYLQRLAPVLREPDPEALLRQAARLRRAAIGWQQAVRCIRAVHARLEIDGGARTARFGRGFGDLPERIDLSDADRHRDGQQVLRMQFEGGALYYKPRCLRVDEAAQRVFERLHRRGLPAPASLPTLALEGYGYQREAQPLRSALAPGCDLDAQAGACLALAWLSNARDLHRDNLRLTPEGLALIDLETWMQPERLGARGFENSGLASALIDFRDPASGSDHCGLGVLDGSACTGFGLQPSRVLAAAERLLVALGRCGGRWLLAPLRTASLRLRVVYRPSAMYARVLQSLLEPRAAGDGALAILATDSLHSALTSGRQRPPEWALVDSERTQLEAGDIPIFEVRADARSIDPAPRLFRRSAQETLDYRLRAVRGATRSRLLRDWSLAMRLRASAAPIGLASQLCDWCDSASAGLPFGVPTRRQVLAGEAGALLDLRRPRMRRIAALSAAILQRQALDLDGGVAGLLLALAHLARHPSLPAARLRGLAATCVEALCRSEPPTGYSGSVQAGLAHGLSGMALALALAARRFGRAEWMEHAERWLQIEDMLIDPETRNWAARPGQAAGMDAWCNGASGILLARALLGRGLQSSAARAALVALRARAAGDPPATGVDHVCCGELGRLLCWQAIAARTGDVALAASAERRFALLEQRWAAAGPRLDAEASPRLIRNRAGLAWGWAAFRDPRAPSPVLFGLTHEDLHVQTV